MKSEFKVLSAVCGWCSDATECIVVTLANGLEMDLCWKCVKNKARAEAKHGQSVKEEVAS